MIPVLDRVHGRQLQRVAIPEDDEDEENDELPKRVGDTIVRAIGGQPSLPAQRSTGRSATFQMGMDSTVNPSNLTSNVGGNGNNGP
ncbi:uncharacterized protein FTOL_10116 [Fusarium torulosum]|uniref:Uncharacterized protein n=1 Tax=Fusarium torulosum TaxID=33205 RepID=A0AAE8MG23_9HYPO|nr:uncharacterized protein FTOL_10116 [Fusarium torulosum]